MLYQEDWIMRQIAMMVRFVAKLILNKDLPSYFAEDIEKDSAADDLHRRLLILLNQGKVNQAENLLFESADTNDKSHLAVALDFYGRLNAWSDEKLTQADFTRAEIRRGLSDLCARYGVDPALYDQTLL